MPGDLDGACTHPTSSSISPSTLDFFLASPGLFLLLSHLTVLDLPARAGRSDSGSSDDDEYAECTAVSDHFPVALCIDALNPTPPLATTPAPQAPRPRPNPRTPKFDTDRWHLYAQQIGSDSNLAELASLEADLQALTINADQFLARLNTLLHRCVKTAFASHTPTSTQADWWTADCASARSAFVGALSLYKQAQRQPFPRPDLAPLLLSMRSARKHYNYTKRAARAVVERRETAELCETFFSNPALFWKAFKDPVADTSSSPTLAQFTQHFADLGVAPGDDPIARDLLLRAHFCATHPSADPRTLAGAPLQAQYVKEAQNRGAGRVSGPFDLAEADVRCLFDNLANGKSFGADRVPAECFKFAYQPPPTDPPPGAGAPPPLHYLTGPCTSLFKHIVQRADYPDSWRTALLTPLHKGKGDPADPDTYRGLAVGCSLAKIFSSMLEKRLSKPFPDDTTTYFWALRLDADILTAALRRFWHSRLTNLLMGDPRQCTFLPKFETYVSWMGLRATPEDRWFPHMRSFIPREHHVCLMRFRLGCWGVLRVQRDRHRRIALPRAERLCTFCTMNRVEDEQHVALECPCYDHIRMSFPQLALQTTDMPTLLAHPSQSALAHFLYRVSCARYAAE